MRLGANERSTLEVRDGTTLQSTKVLAVPGLWSYYPAWSPDMTRLVFSVSPEHHDGENWDLAVMDIATPMNNANPNQGMAPNVGWGSM